jgi:hypothetical protein
MSSALNAHFMGFIKAIKNGGGQPDPKLVHLAQNAHISQDEHDSVETAVWLSLDAVMGWDFDYPSKLARTEGFVGNIREVGGVGAAEGIVDAARRGLTESLKTGDYTKVESLLLEFWAKNPSYLPRHTGRCYPHGHEELRDMKAASTCQIEALQHIAQLLIDTAASTVMNDN